MPWTLDPLDFTVEMTADDAPIPWEIIEWNGGADWEVFNHSATVVFQCSYVYTDGAYRTTILLDTGGSYACGAIKITSGTFNLSNFPAETKLYGSNTLNTTHSDYGDPAQSADWTLLVDQSGETGWTAEETRKFSSSDSTSEFRYFCIKLSRSGASGMYGLAEIELLSPPVAVEGSKQYPSILTINGGSYTLGSKSFPSDIGLDGGSYVLGSKSYNSIIGLESMTGGSKRYNSIIGLKSAVLGSKRYNSIIDLMGDVHIIIPISFSVYNSLFIGAEANILNFTSTEELPFSEIGGTVS